MASFPEDVKRGVIYRQRAKCGSCGTDFRTTNVRYAFHHMLRYADGGDDNADNCVMLCEDCNYDVHNYGNYRQPIQYYESDFPYFYG